MSSEEFPASRDVAERVLRRERTARLEAEKIAEQALTRAHEARVEVELLRDCMVAVSETLTTQEACDQFLRVVVERVNARCARIDLDLSSPREGENRHHVSWVPLIGDRDAPESLDHIFDDARASLIWSSRRAWPCELPHGDVYERLRGSVQSVLIAPIPIDEQSSGRLSIYMSSRAVPDHVTASLFEAATILGQALRRVVLLERADAMRWQLAGSVASIGAASWTVPSTLAGSTDPTVRSEIGEVRTRLVLIASAIEPESPSAILTYVQEALVFNQRVLHAATTAEPDIVTAADLADRLVAELEYKSVAATVVNTTVAADVNGTPIATAVNLVSGAACLAVDWALENLDSDAIVTVGTSYDSGLDGIRIRIGLEQIHPSRLADQHWIKHAELVATPVGATMRLEERELGGFVLELDVPQVHKPDVQDFEVSRMSEWTPRRLNLAVLVVEDNEINREVIAMQLASLGCRTEIAACIDEMWHQLDTHRFDIVLMDCELGQNESGIDATRQIRERSVVALTGDQIPVIAITAHAFDEQRNACLDAGMDGFLTKPISIDDLDHALEPFIAR